MQKIILNIVKSDMLFSAYRIGLFCCFLLLFSCSDDVGEGTGPVIKLVNENDLIVSDTSISPGQKMNFGIEATQGDFEITEFLIKVIGESSQVWYDTGFYAPALKWYGSFIKSYNDNETWEFVVRDRYGHHHSVSILIKNDSISGPGMIDYFPGIILGAQSNLDAGGFLDLTGNLVYLIAEAKQNQAEIDMVYYLGEDEHTLASSGANIEDGIFNPELSPVYWEIRNTTRYIPLEIYPEDFDLVENDSILITSYIEGEGKRKAKNLIQGKVFSFKTQDLRFGMVKVNEVTGAGEGTVSVDIKIQKGGTD